MESSKVDLVENFENSENFEYESEEENMDRNHIPEYFLQQKKLDTAITISLKMRDFCNKIALPLCENLDCNTILELIK